MIYSCFDSILRCLILPFHCLFRVLDLIQIVCCLQRSYSSICIFFPFLAFFFLLFTSPILIFKMGIFFFFQRSAKEKLRSLVIQKHKVGSISPNFVCLYSRCLLLSSILVFLSMMDQRDGFGHFLPYV